jgi:hypothetical protein
VNFKAKKHGKLFTLLMLSFLINCYSTAQTIIVNPDGTHSIVINNGITSTIVNPDGMHSTAITNGLTFTLINPDGTHSTGVNNGHMSIIVNPNGTHSTFINNTATTPMVNTIEPDSDSAEINRADTIKTDDPIAIKIRKSKTKKNKRSKKSDH